MSFERKLFDGSLTIEIPASFADVSDVRQVPDHQEAFVEQGGTASLVVDIFDAVPLEDDKQALLYHVEELVRETGLALGTLDIAVRDEPVGPSGARRPLVTGTSETASFALLRLPEHDADIFLTLVQYTGDCLAIFHSLRLHSFSLFP